MSKADNHIKIGSFIKGSTILVLSNVCLKAISFFLLPLYTKYLTTDMLGVSDSITAFTGLLFPILVMGLDSAYSAFYFDENDLARKEKVFNTFSAVMLISGIIALCGIFVSGYISKLLFNDSSYSTIVAIALLATALNAFLLPYSLEVRMQNRMLLFGIVNIVGSLIMILTNIILVTYAKLGALSLIASTAVVNFIQLALFVILSKKRHKRKYISMRLLKQMLLFALPVLPSAIMVWIMSLSDRYIILYALDKSFVGLYGVGGRFVNVLNVVISAVTMAYTTFAFGTKENKDAKDNYRLILNVMAVVLAGICFTAALFSKELVSLITAEAYHSSYVVLRDLMFAQALYGLTSIVSYGIFFEKKPVYFLIANLAGAIVKVALSLLLVKTMGIAGVAFTSVLGYIVIFSMTYVFAQKLYPCNYGIVRILITMAVLYVAALLGAELSIPLKILLYLVCTAGVIIAFRDILQIMLQYVKRILRLDKRQDHMDT